MLIRTQQSSVRDRQIRALKMRLKGKTYKEIGDALSVSRQYIQQILSPAPQTFDAVMRRASGRCEECGVELRRSGHVHHKKAAGATLDEYSDVDNLAYLCASCHMKAHYPKGESSGDATVPKPLGFCQLCGKRLRGRRRKFCSNRHGTLARVRRWRGLKRVESGYAKVMAGQERVCLTS